MTLSWHLPVRGNALGLEMSGGLSDGDFCRDRLISLREGGEFRENSFRGEYFGWNVRAGYSHFHAALQVYSVSQKYPQTFYNIFTHAKYFSVKFCQFVASLSPLIIINFVRFILIFNKMVLIFTALHGHGMQSRYSDENSVRLSVKRVHCDKTEESYV